jgi:DNA-binding GntR family transcriptional regulator
MADGAPPGVRGSSLIWIQYPAVVERASPAVDGRHGTGARPGRPLERLMTHDLVAEHLRWQIFRGELRPGDRITPERVAEELSISRLPVREALSELAGDGLVVMRPHQRVSVGEFDEDVLRDHFEIVAAVQGLAAGRLAHRGAAEVLDRLAALVGDMERSPSPARTWELSMEFHRVINVEGGSARHRSVLRSLGRMLPRGLFVEVPGSAESGRSGAARILAALRGGDAEAVRDTFVAVQRERADLVVAHLRAQGVFPATDTTAPPTKAVARTRRKSA